MTMSDRLLHIVATESLQNDTVAVWFADGNKAVYEWEELEKLRPRRIDPEDKQRIA